MLVGLDDATAVVVEGGDDVLSGNAEARFDVLRVGENGLDGFVTWYDVMGLSRQYPGT